MITGFVYNEVFALNFNFFSSKFRWNMAGVGSFVAWGAGQTENETYYGTNATSPVYHFGLDPYWHWSDNSMIFLNSYKMKLSVIIGVLQMVFGIFVKLCNQIYKKQYDKIVTIWIPEIFFMLSFFGYMIFCIFYKWIALWPANSEPPALINMLIQIILSPGSISPGNQLFNNYNT